MVKAFGLGVGLFGLWLLLSGHFEPLLLALGLLSCGFAVYLAARMRILDEETVPLQLMPKVFVYHGWLVLEIWKANLAVSRAILARRMPLAQRFIDVPTTQKSDVARVTFANSITLTPGTITVQTKPGHFLVHALTDAAADAHALADMDSRVTRLETG
jgi:multicomponent Na+:H+ antiporter subunit E